MDYTRYSNNFFFSFNLFVAFGFHDKLVVFMFHSLLRISFKVVKEEGKGKREKKKTGQGKDKKNSVRV